MAREYEDAASAWTYTTIRDLHREMYDVLATVGTETVANLPGGEELDGLEEPPDIASPLYREMGHGHTLIVDVDELLQFDLDRFLAAIYDMARDTGRQMVQNIVGHITDVCEDNGQVVSTTGSLADAVIKSVESVVEFDFNEDGSHNFQVYLPNTGALVALEDIDMSPEQAEQLAAAVERRREEWHATRRRRDLP